MSDVPLRCHRCWRCLDEPLGEAPPYSHPVIAQCGTALLMLLCATCREVFEDDRARDAFLERMSQLAPLEASAATDAGLRTLVWEPAAVRLPNRHRTFAVVALADPYLGRGTFPGWMG